QQAVNNPVNKPKNQDQSRFLSYTDNQYVKNKNTPDWQNTDTSYTNKNFNNRLIGVHKFLTFPNKIPARNTRQQRSPLPLRDFLSNGNISGNTRQHKILSGNTRHQRTPLPLRDSIDAGNIFFARNTQEKALLHNNAQEKVDTRVNMPLPQDTHFIRQTARESLLVCYAEKLWLLARKKLYAKTQLTITQQEIARELLFDWYAPVPVDKLEHVHHVYVKRIEMVRRYVAKAPDLRYVQLPYLFFDPDNPNGFTRTKAWKPTAEFKKRKLLQRKFFAIVNFFKRNELADTAIAIPRLQCFKRCEAAIKTLKEPEFLQEFYKATFQILQPVHS
ncbi:hypothetical protein, partial [Aquimarina rhabdastrellae]